MTKTLSRRSLIRTLGASAAVAPFLPLLDRQVEAAGAPKRLLLIFCPNGTVGERFYPTGGETDFAFPAGGILEPLAPFRKDLLIPRNLKRSYVGPGGNHQREIAQLWTYAPLKPGGENGGYALGTSIDQIIAANMPQPTPFKTLEACVYPERTTDTAGWMCYAAPGQPIFSVDDPRKLFQRIAGNAVVGAGNREAVTAQWNRRKSVMDIVKAELDAVSRKLDRGEAQKMQAHLESMRNIEQRLSAASTPAAGGVPKGCAFAPIDPGAPLTGPSNIPTALKLQSDLMISALACDRTRIASLQWTCGGVRNAVFTWLGHRRAHHDISHNDTDEGRQQLAAIHRWYAEQVAYILGRLSAIPEGNGTMLDNTLVVFANGLYLGKSHVPGPIPVVLAGRLGGAVRTGRAPDWSAHQWPQLLVALCQAMGAAQVTKVGDWSGGAPQGLLG